MCVCSGLHFSLSPSLSLFTVNYIHIFSINNHGKKLIFCHSPSERVPFKHSISPSHTAAGVSRAITQNIFTYVFLGVLTFNFFLSRVLA